MWNWIKTHRLVAVLLVVIGYFVYNTFFGVSLLNFSVPSTRSTSYGGVTSPAIGAMGAPEMAMDSSGASFGSLSLPISPSPSKGVAANVPADQRMVVQNSNLSLLVKDVRETGDKVVKYAEGNGGFMVNTSYNRPTESPFATITVRIPSSKLNDALTYFRSQAIKVTNENLVGTDVTDQYVDIQA